MLSHGTQRCIIQIQILTICRLFSQNNLMSQNQYFIYSVRFTLNFFTLIWNCANIFCRICIISSLACNNRCIQFAFGVLVGSLIYSHTVRDAIYFRIEFHLCIHYIHQFSHVRCCYMLPMSWIHQFRSIFWKMSNFMFQFA